MPALNKILISLYSYVKLSLCYQSSSLIHSWLKFLEIMSSVQLCTFAIQQVLIGQDTNQPSLLDVITTSLVISKCYIFSDHSHFLFIIICESVQISRDL